MSIDTVLGIISETQIKVDKLIVRDGFVRSEERRVGKECVSS